jgi:uncharacterized protein YdhG (YjbR/CyaY superfamily)
MQQKAKTVEGYIKMSGGDAAKQLTELRKVILSTVPKAEEKLSYGMPYYGYKGRLAYFAIAKTHIGLYIPPPVFQDHKKELEKYSTSKATVRFPLDKKLPISLIKKLLKARMKINEEKAKKK